MHLDASTLRPANPVAAFTLPAIDEWARALDTAPAPAPPLPRVLPPLPPHLTPGRAGARPPAGATGGLLTWDRQEEEGTRPRRPRAHPRPPDMDARPDAPVQPGPVGPLAGDGQERRTPGGDSLGLDPRSVGV